MTPAPDPDAVIVVRGECTADEFAAVLIALRAVLSHAVRSSDAAGPRPAPRPRYRAPAAWAPPLREWQPAA